MLRTRVITAVVMLAVLYLATAWLSPFHFSLVISALVLIAAWEWTTLMGVSAFAQRLLYLVVVAALMLDVAWLSGVMETGVAGQALARPIMLLLTGAGVLFWLIMFPLLRRYPEDSKRWATVPRLALMGLLALLPAWAALLQLKYLDARGTLVFALIGLVSIADIGAYFVGRRFGHRPLAPDLSPKKSWEGFWGGMVCSVVLAAGLLWTLNSYVTPLDIARTLSLLVLAVVVGIASVEGDLFESMLKRNCGIKDSGRILPGHGGILDRIDSLTAAAPIFVFFLLILLDDVTWQ